MPRALAISFDRRKNSVSQPSGIEAEKSDKRHG